MKILGIDTSTPIGSVALIDGDNLAAEHTLNIVQAHSSRLMPAIDTVLKWSDITADRLRRMRCWYRAWFVYRYPYRRCDD